MATKSRDKGLTLVDQLVADGRVQFTFQDAHNIVGSSATATANLLERLVDRGLVDRVRRGAYVVRELGVLGTRASAEDLSVVVAAALASRPHRMAYRTALEEHDLLVHPARSIQVACPRRVRSKKLSGRPFRWVQEPVEAIRIGAIPLGQSWVSDVERSLLDAGARPGIVGGAAVIAEAVRAANNADPQKLMDYATRLGWSRAVRRLGSIADTLEIVSLAGRLRLPTTPTFDLDLEPGLKERHTWRDSRWRVRWIQTPDELKGVIEH